jgi:D-alanyl-D-alanine carboxypeptidase
MKKLKYIFIILIILPVLIWLAYMPLLMAYTRYRNDKSLADIKQFDATSYPIFKAFIDDIETKTDWHVLIVSGYRNEESQAILKKINPKNAAAGQSKHNFAKAIDICVFKPSRFGATWLRKSSSKKAWENSQITVIAQSHKLNWGGNFKNYHDPVHFEID